MTGDAFAPEVDEDGEADDVQGIININFLREVQYEVLEEEEDAVAMFDEDGRDVREDAVDAIIVVVHVSGRCRGTA